MNQIKIGKFIAETRKQRNLTQQQLADALFISNKTVSKWERGKGLPEISLMMPLCEALQITLNDLLTGESVSDSEYKNKAEENMMNLMKENQENKMRMTLSVICGIITIIAVCSLVVIAAYIEMPVIARIAVLILAVATAAVLEAKAGYYECPQCKSFFVPTMSEYVKGAHSLTKRRLTCPECKKIGWCRHRITR
ncbi:MAG: helix-turn-helix transcriptional regulator [Clostridia bacterium]|nr:helix-turn-helix transcriptional regulator [Clostridia bacterium]